MVQDETAARRDRLLRHGGHPHRRVRLADAERRHVRLDDAALFDETASRHRRVQDHRVRLSVDHELVVRRLEDLAPQVRAVSVRQPFLFTDDVLQRHARLIRIHRILRADDRPANWRVWRHGNRDIRLHIRLRLSD